MTSAASTPGLPRLNQASRAEAIAMLVRCCGATRWAEAMADRRPYANAAAVLVAADAVEATLGPGDWQEAFAHHPRIGGDDQGAPRFAATRQWSRREQSGMAGAPDAVRARLAAANDAYHARFGYVFLICARGRSAEEMLQAVTRRLENDPETELAVAAREQRKITRRRLETLCRESDPGASRRDP